MSTISEMTYVGIDYHRDPLQVAIKSEDGRTLLNRRCKNDVSAVVALTGKCGAVAKVALETCTGSMDFAEELAEQTGWTVEMAHPGVVKKMRLNPDKSDLADAEVLADLTRANWVPRVWLAPRHVRECRMLLNHRESLVRQRTACKLQIRAVLRQNRIPEDKSLRAWTKRWLAWLQKAPLREDPRWVVTQKLLQLKHLERQIKSADERLKAKVPASPLVQWLLGKPGFGLITAWWLATAIGRMDRFRRGKQLSRFCGLTPRNMSSAQRQVEGRVISTCSRELRAKLLQSAHLLLRYSQRWCNFANRLARRGKPKNVIVVAIANRWLRSLVHQAKDLGLTV